MSAMAVRGKPRVADQATTQRALVRRILRVRPDVSPAQLVGILGGRLLEPPVTRTEHQRNAAR
jgi:hypothetical protein